VNKGNIFLTFSIFILLVFCACYSKTKLESQQDEKIVFLIQYVQTKTAEQIVSGVIKYPKREDGTDWFPTSAPTLINVNPPVVSQATLALRDAVVELGSICDERAIPVLAKLRGIDEPYDVKFAAREAIEQIRERMLAERLDTSYELPADEKKIKKYYDGHKSEFLLPENQLSFEEARDWIYYKLLAESGEDLSPKEEQYDRSKHGTKVSKETKETYSQARQLYLLGDYDEAIKLAKEIRKSPERFPRGSYERAGLLIGKCYEELSRYEKAIEAYTRMRPTGCCGTTAIPRRLEKNIGLGRCFGTIGNYKQAIRHYVAAASSGFAGVMSYKDKLPAERALSRFGVNLTRLYMGMVWVHTNAALAGLSRLGSDKVAILLIELYQGKDISNTTWSNDSNRAYLIFVLGMIGYRDKNTGSVSQPSHWWQSHWGEPIERNLKSKTRENIKKTLLEASKHEVARVRLSAVHALDYIGDASVTQRLEEMLKDEDDEVKKAAEAVLQN